MALSVEASELLEEFQWLTEQQSGSLDPEGLERVRLEMADVLIYLLRLADKLDVDLPRAAADKLAPQRAVSTPPTASAVPPANTPSTREPGAAGRLNGTEAAGTSRILPDDRRRTGRAPPSPRDGLPARLGKDA